MTCERCGAEVADGAKASVPGYFWQSPYGSANGYESFRASRLCPSCFDKDAAAHRGEKVYRCAYCGHEMRNPHERKHHEIMCPWAPKYYDIAMKVRDYED